MNFKKFKLTKGNHFIAMQYYGLILNRTLLVLITDEFLIGLKVNGLVIVESGVDSLTRSLTKSLAINNLLDNPYSYMKRSYLKKLEIHDIFGPEIINLNWSNFKIRRENIMNVTYDKRKKWGMGYYPHDGKVYITTKNGRTKEFIILGSQSGAAIKNWIKNEQPRK